MHVTIASDGTVGLAEPAQFTAFDIRPANPDRRAVLSALGADGEPAAEADHVYVTIDAVRRLAAETLGNLDPQWEDGMAKMVEFAAANGWMNQAGDAIKAHIADQ